MKKYFFTDENGRDWQRVSAQAARAHYCSGGAVCLCPVNLRPFGFWHCGTVIAYDTRPEEESNTPAGKLFERYSNAAQYYNCINSETGHYLAYYIPAANQAARG